MAAGIQSVGARLILSGRSRYVSDAEAVVDANKAMRDSILEVADAYKVAAGEVDKASESEVIATKTSADAIKGSAGLTDAAVLASQRRAAASTEEGAAVTKTTAATAKYEGALAGLASNALVKKVSLYGGLGIAASAYEGLKQYMALQQQMTQVSAQAGVAAKNLPTLTTGVMGISRDTGESFAAVAEQLYRIASARAGLHSTNQELLNLTKMSAQLNVLGNVTGDTSQELTARVIGALMNAQLTGAKNPQQIAALANAAVGAGDIRMSQLIASIGRGAIPAAKLVGVSAPQTLAWIDLLTKLGNNPSTAGTLIAHNLISLGGATEQAQKVMEMIGLSPSAIQDVMKQPASKGGGLAGAVRDLLGHMKQFNPVSYYPSTGGNAPGYASAMYQLQAYGIMTPSQIQQWAKGDLSPAEQSDVETKLIAKMFGAAKQSVPIATLIKYLPQYNQTLSQINSQANPSQYAKDVALAQNTPQNTMLRVERSLNTMEYTMGQEVYPTLKKMAEYGGDAALWLGKNPEVTVWLVRIGAAAVALATGVIAINKTTKLWNSFMNIFHKGVLTGQAANTTALDENTAALTRLTDVAGTEGLGGRGGVASKGGTVAKDAETALNGAGETGGAGAIATWLAKHPALGPGAALAGIYGTSYGALALNKWASAKDPGGNILQALLGGKTTINGHLFVSGPGGATFNQLPASLKNASAEAQYKWFVEHNQESTEPGGYKKPTKSKYGNLSYVEYNADFNKDISASQDLKIKTLFKDFESGVITFKQVIADLQQNGLTAVVNGTQVVKVVQSVQAQQMARTGGSYSTTSSAPSI